MRRRYIIVLCVTAVLIALYQFGARAQVPGLQNLSIIKSAGETQFSNGGWKYDRYKELESLDAHSSMTVADLEGPGVITHIHTTRHMPAELLSRGIVIEIYFDNAEIPAVSCPLADFFCDGCNGRSEFFSSNLIECAPWSYNSYIPMPFRKWAKVILRNDTGRDAWNYSYVEWKKLSEWDKDYGYFHAAYKRQAFQLNSSTKKTFFRVKGTGHFIGRQFSVISDEPLFNDFKLIMEGNNEVDIDGRERVLDYLGTEDSFTFSWGFRNRFAGLRAGMPYIAKGDTCLLSIYRFHDYMPIRFDKEFQWSINWKYEFQWDAFREYMNEVDKKSEEGGCWVNYATVFYWYQNDPAGYSHDPLPPVDRRQQFILHD